MNLQVKLKTDRIYNWDSFFRVCETTSQIPDDD